MNRVFFLLVVFVLFSCNDDNRYKNTDFTKGDAVFKIKITDPNQSYLKIKSYGYYEEKDLDEDGTLIDTLKTK
jgi:hypothetical protein